uniref:Calcitonin receptor-stimulating peptide 1 n=1 Tax=Bos mutus grunniens TaxID=30521 RepID=A0A8B9WZG6_BOSMU
MTRLKPGCKGIRGTGRSRAQICGLREFGPATGADIILPLQRGVMGFWKFPPFLVLSILVLYQAGMFHAAPFRSVFDGRFDPATLDEEESRLLLAAMVNDYEQMRARESEKAQKTEGSGNLDLPQVLTLFFLYREVSWASGSSPILGP